MPGLNQTGQKGLGPMTGRKMGLCTKLGINKQNLTTESQDSVNDNIQGQGSRQDRGRRGKGLGMRRNNNSVESNNNASESIERRGLGQGGRRGVGRKKCSK